MQWLPLSRRTAQTSLGTTRFFLSIHLPHLSRRIPCSYWALTWVAVLPSCITLYEISVRQTRDLPVVSLFPHPASFRFHLTMDTLAFGYILPTTGWIRDFNPLETCAARRTRKNFRTIWTGSFFHNHFFIHNCSVPSPLRVKMFLHQTDSCLLRIFLQRIRGNLIYIVVQPVRIQSVRHISPHKRRNGERVIMLVVVDRECRI